MTDCQPYARHNAPPIMGLTMHEIADFSDILIKANDMQLEALERAIRKEKDRRDKQ